MAPAERERRVAKRTRDGNAVRAVSKMNSRAVDASPGSNASMLGRWLGKPWSPNAAGGRCVPPPTPLSYVTGFDELAKQASVSYGSRCVVRAARAELDVYLSIPLRIAALKKGPPAGEPGSLEMSDRPADGERGSKMLRSRDLLAHTDGPSVIEEGSRSVEGTIEAVKKPPLTTWVHGAGMVRPMNECAARERP